MGDIDLDRLLEPCSVNGPHGGDVEYDPVFMDLEDREIRWNEWRPEREEPDWAEVRQSCVELLNRSKHLQVAVWYALSGLGVDGLEGLYEGMQLVHGLLDGFWDGLYPQLDPDVDAYVAERRQNVVEKLNSTVMVLNRFRRIELVPDTPAGTYSWRDCLMALGQVEPGGEQEDVPEIEAIRNALGRCDRSVIEKRVDLAENIVRTTEGIKELFARNAGPAATPDLDGFEECVEKYVDFLKKYGDVKGSQDRGNGGQTGEQTEGEEADESDASAGAGTPRAIESLQDVRSVLESVCRYYRDEHPSSPVPILLDRAKRLVGKNFRDIIEDVAPGALPEVDNLSGVDEESAEQ